MWQCHLVTDAGTKASAIIIQDRDLLYEIKNFPYFSKVHYVKCKTDIETCNLYKCNNICNVNRIFGNYSTYTSKTERALEVGQLCNQPLQVNAVQGRENPKVLKLAFLHGENQQS